MALDLASIRLGTPDDVGDAMRLSKKLVSLRWHTPDEYWFGCCEHLLAATMLHLAYAPISVDDLVHEVAGVSLRHDGYDDGILVEMLETKHDPEGKYGWRDSGQNLVQTHPFVAETLREILDRPSKQRASIFSATRSCISASA